MDKIIEMLKEGDLRTTGRVNEVLEILNQDHSLLPVLFNAFKYEHKPLRMRLADTIEKFSIDNAEKLNPFKDYLLDELNQIDQKEVRWHLCEIIPRLTLKDQEVHNTFTFFEVWYQESRSKIVRTFSLQAMYDLTNKYKLPKNRVIGLFQNAVITEIGSINARARKLLKHIN